MVAEGEGVCYADGAEDMAHKAVKLVNNQQQCGEVARGGLRLIDRHCNWVTQIQIFEQLLESLTPDQ
jgi:hypothetical protein